jgi:hypothetical protein
VAGVLATVWIQKRHMVVCVVNSILVCENNVEITKSFTFVDDFIIIEVLE